MNLTFEEVKTIIELERGFIKNHECENYYEEIKLIDDYMNIDCYIQKTESMLECRICGKRKDIEPSFPDRPNE